tara:strand:- start:140 stop:349 length:210 start_codon:yes stop_codon:yes gene_type:complete
MTLQERIYHTNAMADAIMRGEDNYKIDRLDDEGAFTTFVNLPSPQLEGTGMQKRTYAMTKAMDIVSGIG